jgi:hypothetical protein
MALLRQQLFADCIASINVIVKPIKPMDWWEFCHFFNVSYVNILPGMTIEMSILVWFVYLCINGRSAVSRVIYNSHLQPLNQSD